MGTEEEKQLEETEKQANAILAKPIPVRRYGSGVTRQDQQTALGNRANAQRFLNELKRYRQQQKVTEEQNNLRRIEEEKRINRVNAYLQNRNPATYFELSNSERKYVKALTAASPKDIESYQTIKKAKEQGLKLVFDNKGNLTAIEDSNKAQSIPIDLKYKDLNKFESKNEVPLSDYLQKNPQEIERYKKAGLVITKEETQINDAGNIGNANRRSNNYPVLSSVPSNTPQKTQRKEYAKQAAYSAVETVLSPFGRVAFTISPPLALTKSKIKKDIEKNPNSPQSKFISKFVQKPKASDVAITGTAFAGTVVAGEGIVAADRILKGLSVFGAAAEGYQVYQTVKEPNPENVGASIAGGLAVTPIAIKGLERTSNVVKRIGSEYVPPEEVFSKDVLSGKDQFPQSKSVQDSLDRFNKAREGNKLVAQTSTVTKPSSTDVAKVGEFSRAQLQDAVLYLTPKGEGSPYFLRINKKDAVTEYTLNPFKDMLNKNKPNTIELEYESIGRIPRSIINKPGFQEVSKFYDTQIGKNKIFITKRSEIGQGTVKPQPYTRTKIISRETGGVIDVEPFIEKIETGTTELEAGLPEGSVITNIKRGNVINRMTGFDRYTILEGKTVPIRRFKIESFKSASSGVSNQYNKVVGLTQSSYDYFNSPSVKRVSGYYYTGVKTDYYLPTATYTVNSNPIKYNTYDTKKTYNSVITTTRKINNPPYKPEPYKTTKKIIPNIPVITPPYRPTYQPPKEPPKSPPLVPPPKTQFPKPPKKQASTFIPIRSSKLWPKRNVSQAYSLFTKKGGKKVYIAGGLPKGIALSKGEKLAQKTLRATFGIERSGYTSAKDINYRPNLKAFRQYKIVRGKRVVTPNIFIQKTRKEGGLKGGRLASLSERRAIQLARGRR